MRLALARASEAAAKAAELAAAEALSAAEAADTATGARDVAAVALHVAERRHTRAHPQGTLSCDKDEAVRWRNPRQRCERDGRIRRRERRWR